MMKCLTCGKEMQSRRENYRYTESGLSNIVLANVEVRTCPHCGEREVVIPRLDELHRAIAQALVRQHTKLNPEQIRFLRKYLGWSAVDFARYMAVQPETVSRWESGSQDMGEISDRLLRLLVAHRQPEERYPIEMFRHRLRRTAKATLRFKADPTWRSEEVA
jgi:putative zinc finger/helix-turn-helix YgiT family protein